jgi:prepilin signal peptidase PulO-like enzyme (type II secretory pathway)
MVEILLLLLSAILTASSLCTLHRKRLSDWLFFVGFALAVAAFFVASAKL